jgi:pyruvate dehydrogenase E2 component (dihydrolipoyllysine-residue acetyltransferase)
MRREIEMPRLSDAVEEGVLVTWFVEPGAAVREGDRVAEVQVEKVASEIHAPVAGRIAELLAEPGGVVAQGAVIAILETEGQAAPGPAGTASAGGLASPAARRLARELGVDLTAVAGSGPGGRIVEADVRAAAAAGGAPTVPAAGRKEPVSSMRRTIADRLRAGLASTAQLTLTAEADITVLAGRLEDWSAAWNRRASFTEAAVRAVALALREHARLAARWEGDRLASPDRIDVGFAVALDDGLIVPVVRDADRKDVSTLGREIAELAERARLGTLVPSETEGACFSVTNLGSHRIDAFTPLLNPPQTAILGIGRARLRPAVVDGAVVPRTLVVLSLTFDHQVVDGAPAAAFLDSVVELLEAPDRLAT